MEEQAVVNNPVQQPNIPNFPMSSKKSKRLMILLLISITLLVLLVPIPFRYGRVFCKPCADIQNCPKCPKEGEIGWNPSILQSLLMRLQYSSSGAIETSYALLTITPERSLDPTVNWKAYSNVSGNFSIKYPSEWTYVTGGSISTGTETISFGQNVSGVTEDTNSKMSIQMQKTSSSAGIIDAESYKDTIIKGKGSSATVAFVIVDNINGFKITYIDAGTKIKNIIFDKNNLIYSIMFGQHGKPSITTEDENTFDQILATFKFLPASPTGGDQNQVVCTQDAKLCPDGSYVSRQPPNCEFAACPQNK